MRSRRTFLLLTAFAWLAAGKSTPAQAVVFKHSTVTVIARSGRYDLTLDVADSQVERDMGLRYRHDVPDDGGMLFVANLYDPQIMSIDASGVTFATDVLFIRSGGEITEAYPWIPANAAAPVTSREPVVAGLQLAGGAISRFGLGIGDRLITPLLDTGE